MDCHTGRPTEARCWAGSKVLVTKTTDCATSASLWRMLESTRVRLRTRASTPCWQVWACAMKRYEFLGSSHTGCQLTLRMKLECFSCHLSFGFLRPPSHSSLPTYILTSITQPRPFSGILFLTVSLQLIAHIHLAHSGKNTNTNLFPYNYIMPHHVIKATAYLVCFSLEILISGIPRNQR